MTDPLYQLFSSPPASCGTLPKWIWNMKTVAEITPEEIHRQFTGFKEKDGYAGVMIVLWKNDHYMDEIFFQKYRYALEIARDLQMTIVLWDENGFPSGTAGGLVELRHPDYMAKQLDMREDILLLAQENEEFTLTLPEGQLMAVVAMRYDTSERSDVTDCVRNSILRHRLPAGIWRILSFTLADASPITRSFVNRRLIDYLSAEAVDELIACTHQAYYDRFSEFFGDVIRYAFYDEPSFWHVDGGRIWTGDFNRAFEAKHGYNPATLYPALFMDIGPDTARARNALFSLRADLYANRYVGRLSAWCEDHGIQLTGHMDQEEILCPVPISGDLMKVMGAQHIPGIDEIGYYNRASAAYKIASSVAYNYDKPEVMCEVYGAMGENMPADLLIKQAMDEFAKGVNFLVPHGTWYDGVENVIFPPELSFRNERYAAALTVYNEYATRCSAMLRGGRHVCDIALLYPIEDLQAGFFFDDSDPYLGGRIPAHVNYTTVGEQLSLTCRHDFTYLHPEVLDARCRIDNGALLLENETNRERYDIVILPGMEFIGITTLLKLEAFVRSGGVLIAAGKLPDRDAEQGRDREIRQIITSLFPLQPREETYTVKRHGPGSTYLPNTAVESSLAVVFEECGHTFDVTVPPHAVRGGNFTYIHKIREGRDLYFFANSGDDAIRTTVRLKGVHALEAWDPHTAARQSANSSTEGGNTLLSLDLPAQKSVFLVEISNEERENHDR